MPSGFQDFWVTGARFYFKKDPVGGVEQGTIDLGLIEAANVASPTFDSETLELKDSDGGLQVTVDERLISNNEEYEIQLSNISPKNLDLLFLGGGVQSFIQGAGQKAVSTRLDPGFLQKLHDDNTLKTPLYNLRIEGVMDSFDTGGAHTEDTATAMSASANTITTGTDLSLDGVAAGSLIIVRNNGSLANVENARTYKVASIATTTITVEEDIEADESAITATLVYKGTGDTGTIYDDEGVDFDYYSHERGLVSVPSGSSITAGQNFVLFSTIAVSGNRLIEPLTVTGTGVRGTGFLVWGRGNNAEQSVRESVMVLTPSAAAFSAEAYSTMTLTAKVVADTTKSVQPAGRLLTFLGDVPTDV